MDDDWFLDGCGPSELHLQRLELKGALFTFLHPVVVNPDLADGEDVSAPFVVRERELRQKKNGEDFLKSKDSLELRRARELVGARGL